MAGDAYNHAAEDNGHHDHFHQLDENITRGLQKCRIYPIAVFRKRVHECAGN
jgi:hypothetical protein